MNLNIGLRKFAVAQFSIVTLLVLLGTMAYLLIDPSAEPGQWNRLLLLLDVGVEQSLPTYFSVLNLLLSALLLLIVFNYERTKSFGIAYYWGFLALVFLGLSFDEFASIHEKLGKFHDILVDKQIIPPLVETHPWLPFGVLFVVILGISLLPFLKSLPRTTLVYFVAAGFIFLSGALGFEFLGALMLSTGFVESTTDLAYLLRRILEEGFEMYGIALFNCALVREISIRNISLAWAPGQEPVSRRS